jgi:hypothetical protein
LHYKNKYFEMIENIVSVYISLSLSPAMSGCNTNVPDSHLSLQNELRVQSLTKTNNSLKLAGFM